MWTILGIQQEVTEAGTTKRMGSEQNVHSWAASEGVSELVCDLFCFFFIKYHLKSYLIFGFQKVTGRLDFIQQNRFYD